MPSSLAKEESGAVAVDRARCFRAGAAEKNVEPKQRPENNNPLHGTGTTVAGVVAWMVEPAAGMAALLAAVAAAALLAATLDAWI